jgi:hypothetical protein
MRVYSLCKLTFRPHRMYVLAENLGLDLEDELYILARYLIATDRARLVDAVRPSLRNIFMPNTTTDRS